LRASLALQAMLDVGYCCRCLDLTVSPEEIAEPIEMPLGWRQTCVVQRSHALGGEHMGATLQIWLNHPWSTALWTVASFTVAPRWLLPLIVPVSDRYYKKNDTILWPFVWDYLDERVREETFTHSHLSWSSIVLYQLPPSATIHSILPVQFSCLKVLLHNLSPSPLCFPFCLSPSTSYSIHFHPIIVFFLQHMPIPDNIAIHTASLYYEDYTSDKYSLYYLFRTKVR